MILNEQGTRCKDCDHLKDGACYLDVAFERDENSEVCVGFKEL